MRDEFPVVLRSRAEGQAARRCQEIVCSRCPATSTISLTSVSLPAHTAALKFGQRGWKVVGVGKHLCPACAAAEAARRKTLPNQTPPDQPKGPAMAAKSAPQPSAQPPVPANENAGRASAAASDAIVDLYMLLGEYYDKARKTYAEGWDDARVAREAGLSPVVVAERRERDFGPLVKDTTREDLKGTLRVLTEETSELETLLRSAERAVSSARVRLQNIVTAVGEVERLSARLAAGPAEKAA